MERSVIFLYYCHKMNLHNYHFLDLTIGKLAILIE